MWRIPLEFPGSSELDYLGRLLDIYIGNSYLQNPLLHKFVVGSFLDKKQTYNLNEYNLVFVTKTVIDNVVYVVKSYLPAQLYIAFARRMSLKLKPGARPMIFWKLVSSVSTVI